MGSDLRELAEQKGRDFDDIESWVRDALTALPVAVAEPARELSRGQLEALDDAGIDISPARAPVGGQLPSDTTMGTYIELVVSGLAVGAVAERLGVGESRVRQLLGARKLYGMKQSGGGGTWVVPSWQFVGRTLVPGMEMVNPHLPVGLHPVTVFGFVTSPQPELDAMTPLEWLTEGRNPADVVDLVAALELT